MKLTFDEKKLLYAYGNPDLALTRKRLYEVAGLTVDPDLNRLVFDFVRKLENESLHLERWYDQMFYFVRAEMECYAGISTPLARMSTLMYPRSPPTAG